MTFTTPSDVSATVRDLTSATAGGDLDRADTLLDFLQTQFGTLPATALAAIGELHLRRQRWSKAAAAYDRIAPRDVQCDLKRQLARNLAALQEHRPQAYDVLNNAAQTQRYQLMPAANEKLTILLREGDRQVCMTPGRDPQQAVNTAMQRLYEGWSAGNTLGIMGVGDGYLLNVLAHNHPPLSLNMRQSVLLFEPEPDLLLACLLIHDYAGEQGPILDPRFRWFVGPEFERQFRHAIFSDLYLPIPTQYAQQGLRSREIDEAVHRVLSDYGRHNESLRVKVEAAYARWTPERLAAIFSERPPRQPRVLFLTSRFTTVLQYAARDAAAAFRQLGWEARIQIEPDDHSRINYLGMRQEMLDFQPDLVFLIDHLRFEQPGLFPASLPVVCWIQDLLPHLTDMNAGRSLTPRDFVLSFCTPLFTGSYAYPQRQCIDVPMMMTLPAKRPASWSCDGDDLVYVSNGSAQPRQAAKEAEARFSQEYLGVYRACCEELFSIYDRGGSLSSHYEIRRLIDRVGAAMNHTHWPQALRQLLVEVLWNPLNITLYRQQALGWIADVADDRGLSLSVYGRGWEQHPRFARYAKGVVQHGQALAELTRRTRISLQLEPYVCVTHHRLLDGLLAGGFFLIRQHPGNTALQELSNWLDANVSDEVQNETQALRSVTGRQREQLQQLIERARCLCFHEPADPIEQVRCWQRANVVVPQPHLLPALDEVSFSDAAQCRSLIERFVNDGGARENLAAQQRASVEHRLTFPEGIRRVVQKIGELIASEQPQVKVDAA